MPKALSWHLISVSLLLNQSKSRRQHRHIVALSNTQHNASAVCAVILACVNLSATLQSCEGHNLTVRLRMQAAELAGQSAERLRLARAALWRQAPLRLRCPTDLLQALRLLGAKSSGRVLLFSPLCRAKARLALQTKLSFMLQGECQHPGMQSCRNGIETQHLRSSYLTLTTALTPALGRIGKTGCADLT